MAVPSVITDLNVSAGSNSPAGTDPIGSTLDDYLRAIQSIVRREQAQGASIASAATTNIASNTDGNYIHITGTTTITSFGTVAAGVWRSLVFDGVLTITHNATSLILPGGANITTAVGDVAHFVSEGSGNWRCVAYNVPVAGSLPSPTDESTKVATTAFVRGEKFGIAASVASNALTLSLKRPDGTTDPSASTPVYLDFHSATATDGGVTRLAVTAASSIVLSSGSTLGATSGVAFKGWIVAFNDAGTVRLGVINCLNGLDIYPLSQFSIASSTAEGGVGGADNAGTFYTGTAVTSKSYCIIGYFSYESGLATAGAYASVPSRLQVYDKNVPLPGYVINVARTSSSAVATGSTVMPVDDTIPQITEGDQYLSKSITPTSAANVLQVNAELALASSTGGSSQNGVAIFRDSTANAVAARVWQCGGTSLSWPVDISHRVLSGSTSSTTFQVRSGAAVSGTITFNGGSSSRQMGGVMASNLTIQEIVA